MIKKLFFSLLALIVTISSFAQGSNVKYGVDYGAYYITGSTIIGARTKYVYADTVALLQVGGDTVKRGMIFARAIKDTIVAKNFNSKKAVFFYNIPDSNLYHLDGDKLVRYLTDKDTTMIKGLTGIGGGPTPTLQSVATAGDSTTTRIKAKRLIVGLGPGMAARDTNGAIVYGWTQDNGFMYSNAQAAMNGGVAIDSGVTTVSGNSGRARIWNSGGTALISGFGASAEGALWKSAAYGVNPLMTASGTAAKVMGYCAQTVPSWVTSSRILATSSASLAGGLCQGSSLIQSIDGATFAWGDVRDSGKICATENAAFAIGACEQEGQIWSDGGGTFAGGMGNKGRIISGTGAKGHIPSGTTNHGSFVYGSTYWYNSRLFAFGEGSWTGGFANIDSCGSTDSVAFTFGENVVNRGKHTVAFGRNYRTYKHRSLVYGIDNYKYFEVDSDNNVLLANNGADTIAYLSDLPNTDCPGIDLDMDLMSVSLPPTCWGTEDGAFFWDETGEGVTILVDGLEYDEMTGTPVGGTGYAAGSHTVHVTLNSDPTCTKVYTIHLKGKSAPIGFDLVTSDASYLTTDGEIQVMPRKIFNFAGTLDPPTIFLDGLNVSPGRRQRVDTGWHQVVAFTFNEQFSGICADTQNVHIRAERDSGSIDLVAGGTHTIRTNYRHTVFTGSTSTFTLPVIAGNVGIDIEVINRGSGTVTVNTNGGGNVLIDLPSGSVTPTNTMSLNTTMTARYVNDGTYWIRR